jgi:transcriptional regulator of acetoin/glycerol metabolism
MVLNGVALGDQSEKKIDEAWEYFLANGGYATPEVPVRPLVMSSWERCHSEGVNPNRMAAPRVLDDNTLYQKRRENRALINCAQIPIEHGKKFLEGLKAILFLTDMNGTILEVVGDSDTIYNAEIIGLVPGSAWAESCSGSNAVGTALANKMPVQVHGYEHYCQGFKPWTCTASVIKDPFDGRIIGVIDLSGLRDIVNAYHLPLVASWASQIETRLAQHAAMTWAKLEDKSLDKFGARTQDGQMLFDASGHLVKTNESTARALASHDIRYDLVSKESLAFERFGGDIRKSHQVDAPWLNDDWVEPITDGNKTIGFSVTIPRKTRGSHTIVNIGEGKHDSFAGIIGKSRVFKEVVNKARRIAQAPLPVLLLGETGVGKEIFAQAIHKAGPVANGPFIDLNCAGLSKDILASELFGYVDGAFTGARKGGMIGKIEAAHGGVLFLDEIGEMDLEIQPVFLRVLQEKKVCRVGDVKSIDVDFRLMAATNRDLFDEVKKGRFRKDLYYRISSLSLSLPPLRRRKEDIKILAEFIFNKVASQYDIIPRGMDEALINMLKECQWHGNVRELTNVIEVMCFMSQNTILTPDDFPLEYQREGKEDAFGTLDMAEFNAIKAAIQDSNGNLTLAARNLNIAKSTLYLKMKKYGITRRQT